MQKISRDTLYTEYVVNEMTDSEIAEKYGRTRPAISKMRKRMGIKTKDFTGYNGESLAKDKLLSHGFKVEDMNETSMTHPFDLLINDNIRIDVKSALSKDGYYLFTLSEKPTNGHVESDTRIRLRNGRTKKRYDKTCDYILLVGMEDDSVNQYFVIPSSDLPQLLQGIKIPSSLNSKYAVYKDRWDFLVA